MSNWTSVLLGIGTKVVLSMGTDDNEEWDKPREYYLKVPFVKKFLVKLNEVSPSVLYYHQSFDNLQSGYVKFYFQVVKENITINEIIHSFNPLNGRKESIYDFPVEIELEKDGSIIYNDIVVFWNYLEEEYFYES